MFSRFRAWLRSLTAYSASYEGWYEPSGRRIVGFLHENGGGHGSTHPPSSVVFVRDGQTIGATTHFRRGRQAWTWLFELDLGFEFSAQEVLQDRVSVVATDGRGHGSKLRMDGATQLGYIRDSLAPSEIELVIRFSHDGNRKDYLISGWYDTITELTWTKGTESTLAVSFVRPGSKYRLELLVTGFAPGWELTTQTLVISVDNLVLGKFSVGSRCTLVECDIPPELAKSGKAIIRFEHPDAARPCDFSINDDSRTIALAFKEIKLRRYT